MGHHPAHKLPFGLQIRVSFAGRNPLHRCLPLLTSYERFAGRIRQEFSMPLYKRAAASMMHITILTKTSRKAPYEPTQQQGFLWKKPHQLQSKAPYKFCSVTIATLLRRSHRVVQDSTQVIEPIRQGEERRHRPRFKIGYKERSSSHSYSLVLTETLDSTGFSD